MDHESPERASPSYERDVPRRVSDMMSLCEALRTARETNAMADGRILRDATCRLVTGLKADGLPIERVIARVRTLAVEAGFPASERASVRPEDEHLRILLDEVIRICVETYYR